MEYRTSCHAREYVWMKPAKHIIGLITRRDVDAIHEAVSYLPESGKIVEVGAWVGKSTIAFAEACKKQNKKYSIHTIDRFCGGNILRYYADIVLNPDFPGMLMQNFGVTLEQYLDYACKPNRVKYFVNNFILSPEEHYEHFLTNVSPWDNITHERIEYDVDTYVFDGQINLMFYDGDHTYDATYSALNYWNKRLVAGGILCCHDYEPVYEGAMKAIQQFAQENDKELIVPKKSTVVIIKDKD